MDEFSENFQRGGGGGISDPKNFVSDLFSNFEGKNNEFSEKEGVTKKINNIMFIWHI